MKPEANVWLEQAEEHFSDAMFMYENSRYSGAVFFCHQALEKILKAAIVEFTHKVPPKSHALEYLFAKSELTPQEKDWPEKLADITRHFWRVRYGDYRRFVYVSKNKVEPTIISTKQIFLWVKQQLENT